MIKTLKDAGATENSGDNKSYTAHDSQDMYDGSYTSYTYHLIDFTDDELDAIAAKVR
jgi:hypothetical protein